MALLSVLEYCYNDFTN